MEDALLREKIPYVVVGGACFYERKEVKDLLGYLRVATGRDEDGDAVRRCINAPFRYLGKAFVDRVMATYNAAQDSGRGVDWPFIVKSASASSGIQRRQAISAGEWCDVISRVGDMARSDDPNARSPGNILLWIIQRTGFVKWLVQDEGEESIENSAASNVRELARIAQSFATVDELLDYVDKNIEERAAQQRKSSRGDRVLLMSIHRSKGLEWPLVWVCGCNDGILPHAYGDVEEERRLFYVAVTRARDEVVCSYVAHVESMNGPKQLRPSAFLADAGLLMGGAS
jgi:DNA helicase-2/ATP-dependent DNA helicase PcrA